MGLKVGDVRGKNHSVVLEGYDAKWKEQSVFEGWRRNGKNEVVGLKVGDVMERTQCVL